MLAYLLAPAVVNGDGIGYLKATVAGARYPGHLGLLPVFGVVRDLVKHLVHGPDEPVTLLGPIRALCHVAGGLSVAWLFVTLRPRGRRAAWTATLGFGASYAVVAAASDVESYALALVPITACLWALDRRRPLVAAVAAALATLLHVGNVLFGLALVLAPGTRRQRAAAVGIFGALIGAAYFVAVQQYGLGWLREMHHGFAYPLSWRTAPATLHGLGKALIYAPYLYEASWLRVGLQTALGVAVLLVLVSRRPALDAVEGRWLLAWLVPFALLGVSYFPSDHERWVFVLPLLWYVVGRTPRSRDPLVVLTLVTANLALWVPVAKDRAPLDRAAAVRPMLLPGDLVISPGHAWDELVGFESPVAAPGIERLPLVYHAGITPALPAFVAEARRRAARTIILRLDGSDADPRGWKELAAFGITRDNVGALLPGLRFPLAPGVELLVNGSP